MSYAEALQWFDYVQRRGIGHTDRLLATLCAQLNHALGGKATPEEFLGVSVSRAPAARDEMSSDDLSTVFGILLGAAQ